MQSTIGYILEGKFFKEVALCQLTKSSLQRISERGEKPRSGRRNIWQKSVICQPQYISQIETKKKMASFKRPWGKIAEALM